MSSTIISVSSTFYYCAEDGKSLNFLFQKLDWKGIQRIIKKGCIGRRVNLFDLDKKMSMFNKPINWTKILHYMHFLFYDIKYG